MSFVMCSPVFALASTKTYSYKISVPAHLQNGREDTGRYRGDVSGSNKWGVKVEKSSEGSGTATDFWLEVASGKNVSHYVRAYEDGNWYKKDAFESARNQKVFLTAEDNYDVGYGYIVSGRWVPKNAKNV